MASVALLILVSLWLLVAPATGRGAAHSVDGKDQLRGSRVSPAPFGPGGVALQAGTADSDITITTDDETNTIVITDQAGVTIWRRPGYGELCNQISPAKVRCELFEPGGLRAVLGAGDDTIDIRSTRPATVAVAGYSGDDTIIVSNPAGATGSRLRGSSGDDVILAGPSDDLLNGGPGADVIKGSAGDDLLDGKAGLDSFSGGKGDDEVEADHDDRDRSIRCGPGNDAATVDRDLDPPPSQCQHIRRR